MTFTSANQACSISQRGAYAHLFATEQSSQTRGDESFRMVRLLWWIGALDGEVRRASGGHEISERHMLDSKSTNAPFAKKKAILDSRR